MASRKKKRATAKGSKVVKKGQRKPAKKAARKTAKKGASKVARKVARKAAKKAERNKRAGKSPVRASASTTKPKKRSIPAPDIEVDAEVLEFIEALDRYKKEYNRPFPSWSEVLHVIRRMGYRR